MALFSAKMLNFLKKFYKKYKTVHTRKYKTFKTLIVAKILEKGVKNRQKRGQNLLFLVKYAIIFFSRIIKRSVKIYFKQ